MPVEIRNEGLNQRGQRVPQSQWLSPHVHCGPAWWVAWRLGTDYAARLPDWATSLYKGAEEPANARRKPHCEGTPEGNTHCALGNRCTAGVCRGSPENK